MDYKNLVKNKVDEILPNLVALSDYIWENPEYNFEEYKSSKAFAKILEKNGFEVEFGVAGLETAVKATYISNKEGPNIGFFGEYDAVPGMGHSCGHNLMAAMAVGAGIVSKDLVDNFGGTITVFGTPAEEGGGGKVKMLENGAFDQLDVAMILHSANETVVNDISYSRTDIVIDFYGVTSHAATWPEEGKSALTPMLELFNLLNAMKLEIGDKGKILGIITKGGDDPIYVPDHCQAKFTVRSFSMKSKLELLDKLINTAKGLGEITDTKVEYTVDGYPYEDIRNNEVLEEILEANFVELGETVKPRRKELGIGCTDMGNVTHKIPSLQSYVQVVPIIRGHTNEFECAVKSEAGHNAIAVGTKALAMTAMDLLSNQDNMIKVKDAFDNMKKQYGLEE